MSDVTLTSRGRKHEGWKSVRIRRAMDEVASSFDLSLTDRWSADSEPVPLDTFEPVTVSIKGERVITGYVDAPSPSYDENTWTIDVSGRSRTGQLVDCSAVYGSGGLAGVTVADVARALAEPFGIGVVTDEDVGAVFASVQIEPGETVSEVVDRLARQRRLWVSDTVDGNLRFLRRSGAVQDTLIGPSNGSSNEVNILSADGAFDGQEQFSEYTVKGQTIGSDLWTGEVSAAAVGKATDASVPLHRPLVILSETQGADAALRERAVYEAALRRGRARTVTYRVAGWSRGDRALWEVGKMVAVRDDRLRIDANLLVVATEFIRSEEDGIVTELTCAEPEAYDLLAIPETKAASPMWGGS